MWKNGSELTYMPRAFARQVSRYLTCETLACIDKVFANAKKVMAWLAKCASAVAQTGRPVQWQSPIGFPILQAYYEDTRHSVSKLTRLRVMLRQFECAYQLH